MTPRRDSLNMELPIITYRTDASQMHPTATSRIDLILIQLPTLLLVLLAVSLAESPAHSLSPFRHISYNRDLIRAPIRSG